MTDLLDLIDPAEPEGTDALTELRLGPEPATILLFTSDGDDVGFHYERSEEYRSYVVCPGGDCPLCFMGTAPDRVALLPVYNLETGGVEVLRLPLRKGIGSLAAQIAPLLKRPDIASTLVLVRRNGTQFRVETRPVAGDVDRGRDAIARYLAAREAGLKLVSAFHQPTSGELADLDRVRRKLDAIGGYPPSSPNP